MRRYLPGILGALLVVSGVAVVTAALVSLMVGLGAAALAAGVFLLVLDARVDVDERQEESD